MHSEAKSGIGKQFDDYTLSGRHNFVTQAKGFGIILVIIGHFVSYNYMPPAMESIRLWIYSFHMPLFMILSGFLFGHTLRRSQGKLMLRTFIGKKFKRLIIPYFFVSASILLLNYALHTLLHIEVKSGANIATDLLRMTYENVGGSNVFLWFLYTLFLIFVISATVLRLGNIGKYLLPLLALLLFFTPLPETFYLSSVGHYLIHFCIGMGLYTASQRYKGNYNTLLALLIATSILLHLYLLTLPSSDILHFTRSLLATVGFLGLFYLLSIRHRLPSLHMMGQYSAHIYLLHMAGIHPIRIIYDYIGIYTPATFFVALSCAVVCGILFPILFTRYVVNRSRLLSFLLGGKS